MTTRNYDDYDWSNPHEEQRSELDEAMSCADEDGTFSRNAIRFLLEMAWMRGHHAATELGASELANPFKIIDKDRTTITREWLAEAYPNRNKQA